MKNKGWIIKLILRLDSVKFNKRIMDGECSVGVFWMVVRIRKLVIVVVIEKMMFNM